MSNYGCAHIQTSVSIFTEKLLKSDAKNKLICENAITGILHTTGYGLLV